MHRIRHQPRWAALACAMPMAAGLVLAAPPAASGTGAADATGGVDLRSGAVFSMSNAPAGNRVVVYDRVGGRLQRVGSFATGGRGSGGFEDSANGLVLGSPRGESAPNNLLEDGRLLFATNAGSGTITVFRVLPDRLQRVQVVRSGGAKPVSVTVNRGLLYVLNSGETSQGLTTSPNCTTGSRPSVTGFRVSDTGRLTPIPGSTRLLSGDRFSGCAQVSFTPDGSSLVATERLAVTPGETPEDEGRINTYAVRADGTLGTHRVVDATGQGPFGFTFSKSGTLVTTEQFDGPDGPGRGAAAAYRVRPDGTLARTSGSVHNGGTDTCWAVVTDDGRYAYTSSFFGTGRISSYRVGADGSLRLLAARAADRTVEPGAADLSLSGDSRYLYNVNAFTGEVREYEVGGDGGLRLTQAVQAHEPSPTMGARLGLAAS